MENNISFGFVKIDPHAILPTRATEHSAGYDLYSLEYRELFPGDHIRVRTGVYHKIPHDCVGLLSLRSGWSMKNQVMLMNGIGIIDADYTGKDCEIQIQMFYPQIVNKRSESLMLGDKTNNGDVYYHEYAAMNVQRIVKIHVGDRIAQIIYTPFKTWGDMVGSKRESGFGSTGN